MIGVLIDTGPLVSYFDRSDAHHVWARQAMSQLRPPVLTCDAVPAETCHLFQKRFPDGIRRLEYWLSRSLLCVAFSLSEHHEPALALMNRHRNLPMSLADAYLVTMVEIQIGTHVLTIDRHFQVYRHSGRRVVPVMMPQ